MVKMVTVRSKFALEKKQLEVTHFGEIPRGQDGGCQGQVCTREETVGCT